MFGRIKLLGKQRFPLVLQECSLLRLIEQTVQLEAGFVENVAVAAVEKNVRLIESVRCEVR